MTSSPTPVAIGSCSTLPVDLHGLSLSTIDLAVSFSSCLLRSLGSASLGHDHSLGLRLPLSLSLRPRLPLMLIAVELMVLAVTKILVLIWDVIVVLLLLPLHMAL